MKNRVGNDDCENIKISTLGEDALLSTQNNKKIINYFNDLINKKRFKASVESVRRFNLDENNKPKNVGDFNKKVKILCRKFGLDENLWLEDMNNYILNGVVPKKTIDNLCIVLDREEIGENEYPNGCVNEEKDILNTPVELNPISYRYPIILRISQYASERDIIDYIKKIYSIYIKPIQEKYKDDEILLGKIKSKNQKVQERNKFILDNKEKPLKEIRHLLAQKEIYLDDGLIGKIISNHNKKEI